MRNMSIGPTMRSQTNHNRPHYFPIMILSSLVGGVVLLISVYQLIEAYNAKIEIPPLIWAGIVLGLTMFVIYFRIYNKITSGNLYTKEAQKK